MKKRKEEPLSGLFGTLSAKDLAFGMALGLDVGIEAEAAHASWPFVSYGGALCKAKERLGHGGSLGSSTVTCVACAKALRRLRKRLPDAVLGVFRALVEHVDVLRDVESTAQEVLWYKDQTNESVEPWKDLREDLNRAHLFREDRFYSRFGVERQASSETEAGASDRA